jgi:hypothetical protein
MIPCLGWPSFGNENTILIGFSEERTQLMYRIGKEISATEETVNRLQMVAYCLDFSLTIAFHHLQM